MLGFGSAHSYQAVSYTHLDVYKRQGHGIGVSESAWQLFVARELVSRFPDGLTIIDAIGQWRDRDSGRIVREPSKHVEIVLPGNKDDDARLDAVVAAYKLSLIHI